MSLDSVPGMTHPFLEDLHQRHGAIVLPEVADATLRSEEDVSILVRHCMHALLERIARLARLIESTEATSGAGAALTTVIIPNFLYPLPIPDAGGSHDILAKFFKRHTRTLLRRYGLDTCWFVRVVLRFDPDECFDMLLSDMTNLNIVDIRAFQSRLCSRVLPKASVIDVPRDARLVDLCRRDVTDAIAQTMA
jgi:hypothetical protein